MLIWLQFTTNVPDYPNAFWVLLWTTDLSQQLTSMKKISTIWHTREIVRVEKMDDLFIFIFEDTDDCPDILINNPCAIEGAFLVLQEWVPNLTPPNVHFTKTRIWLQIHGLPFELLRKEVAEELGAYAGQVLHVDWADRLVPHNDFICIYVTLFPAEPLVTGVFLNLDDDSVVWV